MLLPVGTEDFAKVIDKQLDFVDTDLKTTFIAISKQNNP